MYTYSIQNNESTSFVFNTLQNLGYLCTSTLLILIDTWYLFLTKLKTFIVYLHYSKTHILQILLVIQHFLRQFPTFLMQVKKTSNLHFAVNLFPEKNDIFARQQINSSFWRISNEKPVIWRIIFLGSDESRTPWKIHSLWRYQITHSCGK